MGGGADDSRPPAGPCWQTWRGRRPRLQDRTGSSSRRTRAEFPRGPRPGPTTYGAVLWARSSAVTSGVTYEVARHTSATLLFANVGGISGTARWPARHPLTKLLNGVPSSGAAGRQGGAKCAGRVSENGQQASHHARRLRRQPRLRAHGGATAPRPPCGLRLRVALPALSEQCCSTHHSPVAPPAQVSSASLIASLIAFSLGALNITRRAARLAGLAAATVERGATGRTTRGRATDMDILATVRCV